jgi:hypothetical protein
MDALTIGNIHHSNCLLCFLQERWRAVAQILRALVEDYAYSPQANCRKGGLLALAAAAVALADRKGVSQVTASPYTCSSKAGFMRTVS